MLLVGHTAISNTFLSCKGTQLWLRWVVGAKSNFCGGCVEIVVFKLIE